MIIDDVGVEKIDQVLVIESLHDFNLVENEFLLGLTGQVNVLDSNPLTRYQVHCSEDRAGSPR